MIRWSASVSLRGDDVEKDAMDALRVERGLGAGAEEDA